MRLKYYINITFTCLLLTLGLSSCLKDKEYDNGSIQSVHNSNGTNENVIEIQTSATDASNLLITAFDNSDNDTTINFVPVVLATANPAPEDIHVTVSLNPTLVTDYNDENGTEYEIPDSSQYTIINPGGEVTIPKGSNTGYLQIKLKPSDFLGSDWALGFTITNIDKPGYLISGNLKNGMVAFGIKNKYDGHYRVTANSPMVDAGNASFTGRYPMDVYLITQSGNSVAMYDNAIGTYAHSFSNAGSLSYYGSFAPIFIFDDNGNVVSVVNAYGQPAGNGRSAELDPSGTNKWNPADKSIDVKYWMNQPSVVSPHRTYFDEHFTYIGPR